MGPLSVDYRIHRYVLPQMSRVMFLMYALVDGNTMGQASAARKEDAKNEAARQLCQNMGI